MARLKPFKSLQHEQGLAADPAVHAVVSASAGTGKTQVLTARVLRLLLRGARPETILCLTFTKAGAAEMANRIGERLAAWVRMKDAELAGDLEALGADVDPATREEARRLFAKVLEAPGGLRIQTIHSFAQTLLASFPAEAGIAPGFRPIEGRAEQELARRTLAELAAEAEVTGNGELIADIQMLSMRLGEEGAENYLHTCARHADSLQALDTDVELALRAVVGLPEGDIEEELVRRLSDERFDRSMFEGLIAGNLAWGSGAKATTIVANLRAFLAATPVERVPMLATIQKYIVKADGDLCGVNDKQRAGDPDYDRHAADFAAWRADLLGLRSAAALVAVQAAGLRAGRAYAAAYTAAKRANGVADFDDLIRWTRGLLATPGIGEWVRYKLDRRTDHILVDEAQDTNAAQWFIVEKLAEEYFSGSSESDGRWRTLFLVGDFKQAIFSFQGTNPREFENAGRHFEGEATKLIEAARDNPDLVAREFRNLSISASFRSAPVVLDLVDAVIHDLGHQALGLEKPPEAHVAFNAAYGGEVAWWPPFEAPDADEDTEEGEEGWLTETDRLYADHLALEVRRLLDDKPLLASTGRPLGPGDVLILVRSRAELASLIVARLFAKKVPVAGIDRLHLHRPLAVKDLLAAVTFAVQPYDDLNLANLLVSPLVGWTQQQLYHAAFGRTGGLLDSLRDRARSDTDSAAALETLGALQDMADFTTPAQFLETILSGPIQGRRKLLRRLGAEARDPIEELVTAAFEFEAQETPSLERFLAWFGSGDVEIKRDPSAPSDAVRVMTVHGSKGLEAPLVILADATADPANLGPKSPPLHVPIGGRSVPLIRPRKAERCAPFGALIAHEEALDREEHWRLLYVALTRARERLIVAGVRKQRESTESWHHAVGRAMIMLDAETDDEGRRRLTRAGKTGKPRRAKGTPVALLPPPWLFASAPKEARPPKPLAPSAVVEDDQPYPPPSPAMVAAARRGTLLHALFERLPGVKPDARRSAALAWLERSAGVADASQREEMANLACAIISDPAHGELFGPAALAEAPIVATLADGRVVAGTVDRLLVEDERVRIVDFKTGLSVPVDSDAVPSRHRRQLAIYRDALAVIFPGRKVETALLYTAGPKFIVLDG